MNDATADPGNLRRLARAVHLQCRREGPDVYHVSGGEQSHTVQLGEDSHCDCIDFQVHGGACKHLLRVRLARGDEKVIEALQLLVSHP